MNRWPLRWSLFIGALIGSGFLFWKNYKNNGPLLVVEDSFIEFDALPVGQNATRSIKLSNVGNSQLKLQVISSCGCTKAWIDSDILLPNESVQLMVLLSGQASVRKGEIASIDVRTNESPKKAHRIDVFSNGILGVELTPSSLDFGTVGDSESRSKQGFSIFFHNKSLPRASSVELISEQGFVECECKSNEADNGFDVGVTLTTVVPIGDFEDRLTIKIKDDPNTYEIGIRGTLDGPFWAEPRSITLRASDDAKHHGKVVVHHRDGNSSDFAITKITMSKELSGYVDSSNTPDDAKSVRFSYLANSKGGSLPSFIRGSAQIILETQEQRSAISIPIMLIQDVKKEVHRESSR